MSAWFLVKNVVALLNALLTHDTFFGLEEIQYLWFW